MNIKLYFLIGLLSASPLLAETDLELLQINQKKLQQEMGELVEKLELREQMREEFKSYLDQRSALIEELGAPFDRTMDFVNLLLGMLATLPILIALAFFLFRGAVVGQIAGETEQALSKSREKLLHDFQSGVHTEVIAQRGLLKEEFGQLRENLAVTLQHQAEELRGEYAGKLSELHSEVNREKNVIMERLATLGASPEDKEEVQRLSATLEHLKTDNPDLFFTAADCLKQGRALYQAYQLKEALQAFDQALVKDENLAEAHAYRGATLGRQQQAAEALRAHERALELAPDLAEVYILYGTTKSNLNVPEEALLLFDRALELESDNARTYMQRGIALSSMKRCAAAQESFERALEISPDDALTYIWHGLNFVRMGRYAEALPVMERSIEINPNEGWAHAQRGRILLELGRLEEGVAAIEHGFETSPKDRRVYFTGGNALSKAGLFVEGLLFLRRIIEIDPQNAWAYLQCSIALVRAGRSAEALQDLKQAVELNPKLKGEVGSNPNFEPLREVSEFQALLN